jgi:hypothetical protein
MKRIAATFLLVICPAILSGAGTVNFSNGAAGVNSPLLADGAPAYLPQHRVELMMLQPGGSFESISQAVAFASNVPGYFFGGLVFLPGTEPEQEVTLRLRVFQIGDGAEAFSAPFQVKAGGGIFPPANLIGLESVQIQTAQPVGVRLEIQLEESEVILSWPGYSTGELEVTESLISAIWTNVGSMPSMENGFWQMRVPLDGVERYYRIRLEP